MPVNQTPPPLPKPVMPYRGANQGPSGDEQYNRVTDVILGPNMRFKDNLYQAIAILVFAAVGGTIAVVVTGEMMMGLVGVLGGLIVGLIVSGLFLMIYRGMQHARRRRR